MKTKRTSNLKKIKEKKNEEIKIIKHERVGNYNFFSEEIANLIIDKIISYVLTIEFRKKIDDKIKNVCFDFLKKDLSTFIQLNYINYDIDDIYNNLKSREEEELKILKTEIENKHKKKIRNNQMNLNDIFYTYNYPNNKTIKENTPFMYNIYFKEENFWGDLIQPKNPIKERNASTQIDIKIDKNKIKRVNKLKNSSFKKSNKSLITIKKKNFNDEMTKKKKIFDFPSYDIPINIEKNKELPEINKLREERELLLKKKLNEEIKEKEKIEVEKVLIKNISNEKKKLNNFTTDINGDIVLIKEIGLEQFEKEFTSIQSKYNDIINPELNKNNDNNEENILNKNKKKGAITKNISKKKLIKQEENNENNENNNLNNYMISHQKILPSGSNFRLIHPEIGVKISENMKIKDGGNNYFKKYNKYSIEAFLKILKGNKDKDIFNELNKTESEESKIIIEENKNKVNKTLNNFHKKIIKSPSAGNIVMKNIKYNNLSNIINKLDFPEEDFLYFNDIKNLKNDLKINLFKNNSLKKQEKKPIFESNNINDIEKFSKTLFTDRLWIRKKKELKNNKDLTRNSSMKLPKLPLQKKENEIKNNIIKLPRVRIKKFSEENLFNHSYYQRKFPKSENNIFKVHK